MGDEDNDPDRVNVEFAVPMPVNPMFPRVGDIRGISFDRIGVDQAETPSGLVAGKGEKGVETEWDAGNLDSAITWLETHASYLNRLSYDMSDIKEKLGGDQAVAGKGPLGGFQYAQQLAQQHHQVYGSTESGLRTLSENLYTAAEALRTVKRNYETAEGANAMTAQEMQKAFNDAARGGDS
ncbi:hypothetical protein C5N14_14440 [Micromonospora sp. MW-13]|uniref:hypothetical protein n=1 Tax=unclassified Micromonospora TaxID=2617518 RepID=UPI000E44C7F6|nr:MULTISPECIES: hypothetical protein [unclassified Micromonospora]MCX4474654.1 hypothetical protein [Micromonospora sp. NBC_01655]RGC68289.1 hypothetical protein C5N14_14440 [Micromonospora sp. MW-13]